MTASKEGRGTSGSEIEWQRPEWLKFSLEEKRLALITVAATLVANIVTLIIVALALAANQAMNAFGKLDQRRLNLPAWTIFIFVGVALLAITIFSIKRVQQSTFIIVFEISAAILGILWTLFLIFAFLGELAAVK
jgi:uncharacterized membrane protein